MGDVDRIVDTALLLRAQAGDPSALEELIVRHDSALRYFVRRLLDRPSLADDVVQEVWLAAIRHVKRIRSGAAFRVWLYRVARNRAVSHLRGESLRRTRPLDEAIDAAADDDLSSLKDDDAALVHDALGRLSIEHREALTLRFLEELSYDEIAEVLDCSVGTVRSRLHYAKKNLEQLLHARSGAIT
jgi:RNA polymerase sigma-70 factor (ECF subfamily)